MFAILSFLLPCLAGAAEVAAGISDALRLSLGDQVKKVEATLLKTELTGEPGNSPEAKLRSGDVLIFIKTAAARNREAEADTPHMPPAYEAGLQGFGHAAMVAKEKGELYRIESPAGSECRTEFRGDEPYIVLRPRAKVTGNPAVFQRAVDDLAGSFDRLGYQYNPTFKTSVFSWTPAEKAAFRAELQRYRRSPTGPKPQIPDLYCSELPITIHTLLGITPRQALTMGDVIDIGLAAEIKNGKPAVQVVNETTDAMVEAYLYDYRETIKADRDLLADAAAQKLTPADIRFYQDEITALQNSIKKTNELREQLRQGLFVRLGLDPKQNGCVGAGEIKPRSVLGALAGGVEVILSKLEVLTYKVLLNRQVVRPVDFLKDTLSPGGNYEIVGYYPGNLPPSAGCAEPQ